MSAREDVLAAVRRALGATPPGAGSRPAGAATAGTTPAPAPQPREVGGEGEDDLVALFAERVADYRAEVTRCRPDEVGERVRSALGPAARVLVPDGFPDDVVPDPVRDTGLSPAGLDAVDAVVTTASVGIALTGTLVLDHGPGQGRRALTLVPDTHVCVVRAAQVVRGVPDAIARLDPTRPQTWISGPSATSDIELDRVEGVHGPRHLHVVVVG